MVLVKYRVISEFDPAKDYGIKIPRQMSVCLKLLVQGKVFEPREITRQCCTDKTLMKRPNYLRAKAIVSDSISIAKEIGLLESIIPEGMSFSKFLRLESVQYFKNQLRGFKQHHMESTRLRTVGGTQALYLYKLYDFSKWLAGKRLEVSKLEQIDLEVFKKTKQVISLNHVEHLLNLYQDAEIAEKDVIKLVKQYLLDDLHEEKRVSTMMSQRSSIKAYFRKNDSKIDFDFDPKTKYKITSEEDLDKFSLSLDDLFKILTVGRPSIMEKAILLCKFHRGLDNSTFADRFNFQAWFQIVDWFGTEDYEKWDLRKCPVPIKLTRIKTDFTHRGFLDRDAIIALQDWVKIRFKKIGRQIQPGDPIFTNTLGKGITDDWINRFFLKLTRRAGLEQKIDSYSLKPRNTKSPHEMRDLLKSTLIASGVADYVCELAIGHKVGDSYEKQDKLFPEKTRSEYAKASKMINIFSNFTNSIHRHEDIDSLKKEITLLKEENEKFKFELLRRLEMK